MTRAAQAWPASVVAASATLIHSDFHLRSVTWFRRTAAVIAAHGARGTLHAPPR